MTLLLNILWFLLGGFATGLSWMVGAAILAITIVGLPWAGAAFRIGLFAFAPFGRRVVPRSALTGHEDLGSGCLGAGLNVVWFVFAGWYIALAHLLVGLAQAVTLIGIPFAIQNFKLAIIALAPVGKTVTPAYGSRPFDSSAFDAGSRLDLQRQGGNLAPCPNPALRGLWLSRDSPRQPADRSAARRP
jgi:uncharacterized membrane protein YccF (DUF307 family)